MCHPTWCNELRGLQFLDQVEIEFITENSLEQSCIKLTFTGHRDCLIGDVLFEKNMYEIVCMRYHCDSRWAAGLGFSCLLCPGFCDSV